MVTSVLFKILNDIWAGKSNLNPILFLTNLLNGFVNGQALNNNEKAAFLDLLPKDWLKEIKYVDNVTLDKFIKKMDNVMLRIANEQRITKNNIWVMENYFHLKETNQVVGKYWGEQMFRVYFQEKLDKTYQLAQSLFFNGPTLTEKLVGDLSGAKIGSVIKRLLTEEDKRVKFGANFETKLWETGFSKAVSPPPYATPFRTLEQQQQAVYVEKIIIANSSWLNMIYYNHYDKTATFYLKTGKKPYVFYAVPRVAISFLEVKRGKEMWDGFGIRYSLNPTHWIRRYSFLYYEKKMNTIDWKKPKKYQNFYKKPS